MVWGYNSLRTSRTAAMWRCASPVLTLKSLRTYNACCVYNTNFIFMLPKTNFLQIIITYKLSGRDQKGQRKTKGCYLHSSSSTAWCQCLHSRARCNLVGGQQAVSLGRHLDSTATAHLHHKDERKTTKCLVTLSLIPF